MRGFCSFFPFFSSRSRLGVLTSVEGFSFFLGALTDRAAILACGSFLTVAAPIAPVFLSTLTGDVSFALIFPPPRGWFYYLSASPAALQSPCNYALVVL